ncbi:MAG: 2'-5' RNA ligase family protein [Candidatus Pacebacteria bacterium]|nr:2'-5' RNA ligase family protein [Candidatus Paceibacterota bacterium]
MRHCIAYIANEEVQKYFQKLTEELSAQFGISNLSKRVPAHITLKYPFEVDDTMEIESKIQSVVNDFSLRKTSIAPFIISGFNRFENSFETIFMKVEGGSIFEKTIEGCISDLGEVDEDRKFAKRIFHISIARHMNQSQSDEIFAYLQTKELQHFESFFDNIALMKFENEVWSVKKFFKFN